MSLKVYLQDGIHEALAESIDQLVEDRAASRLFEKDSTLWGSASESEASIRLGWVDAATSSIELLDSIQGLRDYFYSIGVTEVILCGMGGSSLAPEVIVAAAGKSITVLDSTDPSQVLDALATDLSKTVVVVSSKSGSTVETDSQKRILEKAFEDAGINKTDRIVIVTDPGSPMQEQAIKDGYRVFLADPNVGGRYSALTAFGLIPSTLAGVEMKGILESAIRSAPALALDSASNPGLVLGAALARTPGALSFKDKIGIVNLSDFPGFGDWLEQLIAESTGKENRGVLPVVLTNESPELSADLSDLLTVGITNSEVDSSMQVTVTGDLGELFLLWEMATAIASRLLGINPFDQPDVESAKIASRAFLENPQSTNQVDFIDGGVGVIITNFETPESTLASAIDSLLAKTSEDTYVSIQCYLNRHSQRQAEKLRDLIADRVCRPTTFGWGPRFLHSTGQYHKGGPKQGIFIQIVSSSKVDLPIPGRNFSLRALIDSQSNGDRKVLQATGRPVLTLRISSDADLEKIMGLISK